MRARVGARYDKLPVATVHNARPWTPILAFFKSDIGFLEVQTTFEYSRFPYHYPLGTARSRSPCPFSRVCCRWQESYRSRQHTNILFKIVAMKRFQVRCIRFQIPGQSYSPVYSFGWAMPPKRHICATKDLKGKGVVGGGWPSVTSVVVSTIGWR